MPKELTVQVAEEAPSEEENRQWADLGEIAARTRQERRGNRYPIKIEPISDDKHNGVMFDPGGTRPVPEPAVAPTKASGVADIEPTIFWAMRDVMRAMLTRLDKMDDMNADQNREILLLRQQVDELREENAALKGANGPREMPGRVLTIPGNLFAPPKDIKFIQVQIWHNEGLTPKQKRGLSEWQLKFEHDHHGYREVGINVRLLDKSKLLFAAKNAGAPQFTLDAIADMDANTTGGMVKFKPKNGGGTNYPTQFAIVRNVESPAPDVIHVVLYVEECAFLFDAFAPMTGTSAKRSKWISRGRKLDPGQAI